MAIQAGDIEVIADKRVAGRIVIEFDIDPVARRVAITTFGTEEVLMHIVVFMTANAALWRVAKFDVGLMAGLTLGRGMIAK